MPRPERAKRKAQHRKNWKQKNPTYHREWWLRNKYGLTLEEYAIMAKAQNDRCAICMVQPPRLVVDHCHETGTVRGLLCNSCNQGLGRFKDNVTVLNRAAMYLSNDDILDGGEK